MKYTLQIIVLLLVIACKPMRPLHIISEDKMEDILYDYHISLALAELEKGDLQENRYLLTQAALRKHNVTEAEFDTSLVYWCRNSEKMVKICERVSQRLSYVAATQGVERKEHSRYSYLKNEGDTANVWNLREGVIIIPNIIGNIYSFTIDADTTYMPGDNFEWVFSTKFVSSDHYQEAWALLSYQFENDSVEGVSQRITTNKQVEIKLNCPKKFKDIKIRSLNGSIYMPLRESGFGVLSVSNFVLVRYHDLTRKNKKSQEDDVVLKDSIINVNVSDTILQRQNPYDIRDKQDNERKINIIKDKPLKIMPSRR